MIQKKIPNYSKYEANEIGESKRNLCKEYGVDRNIFKRKVIKCQTN